MAPVTRSQIELPKMDHTKVETEIECETRKPAEVDRDPIFKYYRNPNDRIRKARKATPFLIFFADTWERVKNKPGSAEPHSVWTVAKQCTEHWKMITTEKECKSKSSEDLIGAKVQSSGRKVYWKRGFRWSYGVTPMSYSKRHATNNCPKCMKQLASDEPSSTDIDSKKCCGVVAAEVATDSARISEGYPDPDLQVSRQRKATPFLIFFSETWESAKNRPGVGTVWTVASKCAQHWEMLPSSEKEEYKAKALQFNTFE